MFVVLVILIFVFFIKAIIKPKFTKGFVGMLSLGSFFLPYDFHDLLYATCT